MPDGEVASMETGDGSEFSRINHSIDLARREVNRQNAPLALVHLRCIKNDVEKYVGTPSWAEFKLLLGEAFLAKGDPAAGEMLRESLDQISTLPGDHPGLMIRAKRAYATFLDRCPDLRSKARAYYVQARQLAIERGYREDSAEINLRIIKIDLHMHDSPELANFRLFKKTADSIYTSQEQLAAWHLHLGNTSYASKGRVFARNERVATREYFHSLLESARERSVEEEFEE